MEIRVPRRWVTAIAAGSTALLLTGCYALRSSDGGGQTRFDGLRVVQAADVALPPGYRIEAVASGLTFPTGVAVDAEGVPHVVEAGYSYGEVWTVPRLLRIERDGAVKVLARGGRNGPWTGVAFSNEAFYVAEGGQLEGGRILRIAADGMVTALVSGLPSFGDHHTNGPAVGPDGKIYFGQGTATNSGVVGEDNAQFGWLERSPAFHDVPCRDIRLVGRNFESGNPLEAGGGKVTTGAFSPFGTATQPGQTIRGELPCSGAVMRMAPSGGAIELVAWGLRNPFGLAFAPDGRLYATENGFDDRGSRPVWGTPDVLWRITPGAWYGWPDHAQGKPLTHPAFEPPDKPAPQPLLAEAPGRPPAPVAVLGVHASANGLDFSTSPDFGHVGQAFIAHFGDTAPTTGKVLYPVGFRVVRVDVNDGRIHDFAVNHGKRNGPASKIGGGGLERPIGVRFSADGKALYVVDFGVMLQSEQGAQPQKGTGVLWRITREDRP